MKLSITRYKLLFFTALTLLTHAVNAQEKLESDMGDQNAQLLKPSETQLETTITYADIKDNGPNPAVGTLFIRHGLTKKVEFRAMLQEGRHRDRFMQQTLQGFYPLCLGLKASILEESKSLPGIALAGYLNLPLTATTKEQSVYWSPAIIAIFEKELNNKQWNFQANTGFQRNSFDTKYQWQATGRVKYQGLGQTELSLEYLDNFARGQQPQHCLSMGIEYAIRNNMEVNATAGSTIFSAQNYQYASIGFSIRLPK